MHYIDLASLQERIELIRSSFHAKKPFHYVVIEDFLRSTSAEKILNAYPSVSKGVWNGTTYIQQVNKFVQNRFEEDNIFSAVFKELNSQEFVEWLQQVTGIDSLLPDEKLFGAGLHQSVNGAFLNVHVDFNKHPATGFYRRLNVLVYLNQNWQPDYQGALELWDMTGEDPVLMETVQPLFNRCVIFETNKHSFHGHPKPLHLPSGMSRKSLATYYYTVQSGNSQETSMHNTIFINTEGWRGEIRKAVSAMKALWERITT